jgi:hypothetical protein
MSFERDGFFSPELDQFRSAMRTTMPTKAWFDYALDLNRIGFDLLQNAATARSENATFTMHGIFVRTHQSFQAALLLAERGLIGDTRTVLRSGFEGAIAIYALAADPAFVQRMIDAHHPACCSVTHSILRPTGRPRLRRCRLSSPPSMLWRPRRTRSFATSTGRMWH